MGDYQERKDGGPPPSTRCTLITEAGDRALKRHRFASDLRTLAPGVRIERPRAEGGKRPRVYVLPPLGDCRAEWDRRHSLKTEWQEDGFDGAAEPKATLAVQAVNAAELN
jgi:hypothetical protein